VWTKWKPIRQNPAPGRFRPSGWAAELNLNANFRKSVQLAEKRLVSVLIFPQQNHRVVGTLNPTPVPERNHGQMAVK
jgi:hypothetical protein